MNISEEALKTINEITKEIIARQKEREDLANILTESIKLEQESRLEEAAELRSKYFASFDDIYARYNRQGWRTTVVEVDNVKYMIDYLESV